jgi:hypothetical protein
VHPHRAEDVPLDRVGVLELVDHRPRRALAQPRGELVAARPGQRLPHQIEHVVVVELAVLGLVIADPRDDRRQHLGGDRLVERHRGRDPAHRGGDLGRQLRGAAGELLRGLAQLVDRGELAGRRGVVADAGQRERDLVEPGRRPPALGGDHLRAALLVAKRGAQLDELGVHRLDVDRAAELGVRAHAAEQQRAQRVERARRARRGPGLEERGEQLAIRGSVGEPLADQRGERGVERDLVGDLALVEQPARRERVLDQDPVAESVDRVDRRVVERGHRRAQPAPRVVVDPPRRGGLGLGSRRHGARQPVEQVADPQPQLGDRLVGERDQQDLTELGASEDQIDHAVLEEERLAGAGGGLDHDERGVGCGQRGRPRDPDHRARRHPRRQARDLGRGVGHGPTSKP